MTLKVYYYYYYYLIRSYAQGSKKNKA